MQPDLSTWVPDVPPETNPQKLAEWEARAAAWRNFLIAVRTMNGGSHAYVDWTPHAKQAAVWYDLAQLLVILAGNRVGKTLCGKMLDAFLIWGMPPLWFLQPRLVPYLGYLPFPRTPKPWNLWIITPDADVREATFMADAQHGLLKLIPPQLITKRVVDRYGRTSAMHTPNAIVRFMSQDQKIKKLMGLPADRIHVDEELYGDDGEMIMGELIARLIKGGGRICLTMTPVETAKRGGDSVLVNDIIRPTLEGKRDGADFSVHQWHLDDNTFFTQEERDAQKRKFLDENGNPTWMYELRICGAIVGQNVAPVFDPRAVEWQRQFCEPPQARGWLHDEIIWETPDGHSGAPPVPMNLSPYVMRFVPERRGLLYLWRRPVPGVSYTIGVDTARGVVGGNPSCAAVFNRRTGTFDGFMWGLIDPTRFMIELIRLGAWFNMAWICVEEADQGPTMLTYLTGADYHGSQRYPNLYLHSVPGKFGNVQRERPGFPTQDRDFMLDTLASGLNPRVKDDPSSALIRLPWTQALDEIKSVRKVQGGVNTNDDKVVYPRRKMGPILTHCDIMVACALALVAHNSPTCPVAMRELDDDYLPADPRAAWFKQNQRRETEALEGSERVELVPDDGSPLYAPW